MSESLPLTISPWLLYRQQQVLTGNLLLTEMPHLIASQDRKTGVAQVKVAVKQREDGQIVLMGQANIELSLQCQRCLAPLDTEVEADFEFILVKYEHQLALLDEDDDDALVCQERLAIAPLIEQELILSLPMIAKHADCRVEYENTANDADDTHQPFANLKDLFN